MRRLCRLADAAGVEDRLAEVLSASVEQGLPEEAAVDALAVLAGVHRSRQAWAPLVAALRDRARLVRDFRVRRDLWTEVAEVAGDRLGDAEGAREAWTEVASLLEQEGEEASARPGGEAEAAEARVLAGRIQRDRLREGGRAIQSFRAALASVPDHPGAHRRGAGALARPGASRLACVLLRRLPGRGARRRRGLGEGRGGRRPADQARVAPRGATSRPGRRARAARRGAGPSSGAPRGARAGGARDGPRPGARRGDPGEGLPRDRTERAARGTAHRAAPAAGRLGRSGGAAARSAPRGAARAAGRGPALLRGGAPARPGARPPGAGRAGAALPQARALGRARPRAGGARRGRDAPGRADRTPLRPGAAPRGAAGVARAGRRDLRADPRDAAGPSGFPARHRPHRRDLRGGRARAVASPLGNGGALGRDGFGARSMRFAGSSRPTATWSGWPTPCGGCSRSSPDPSGPCGSSAPRRSSPPGTRTRSPRRGAAPWPSAPRATPSSTAWRRSSGPRAQPTKAPACSRRGPAASVQARRPPTPGGPPPPTGGPAGGPWRPRQRSRRPSPAIREAGPPSTRFAPCTPTWATGEPGPGSPSSTSRASPTPRAALRSSRSWPRCSRPAPTIPSGPGMPGGGPSRRGRPPGGRSPPWSGSPRTTAIPARWFPSSSRRRRRPSGERRAGLLLRVAVARGVRGGDPVAGAEAVRRAVEADPGCLDGLASGDDSIPAGERARLLAWGAAAFDEHGEAGRALGLLEAAHRLDPGAAEVGDALERCYREGGNAERLADLLRIRASVAAEPEVRVRTLLELGDVLDGKLHRPAEAEAAFREALSIGVEPGAAAGLHLRLARMRSQDSGDPAEAQADYEQVLAHEPGNLAAIRALADIRTRAGDRAGFAKMLVAEARHVDDPARAASALVEAARILELEGHPREETSALYEEALARVPDHLPATLALSEALEARGDFAGVARLLDGAVPRLADGDPGELLRHLCRLGLAREHVGDASGALDAYRQARKLDPRSLARAEGNGGHPGAEGRCAGGAAGPGDHPRPPPRGAHAGRAGGHERLGRPVPRAAGTDREGRRELRAGARGRSPPRALVAGDGAHAPRPGGLAARGRGAGAAPGHPRGPGRPRRRGAAPPPARRGAARPGRGRGAGAPPLRAGPRLRFTNGESVRGGGAAPGGAAPLARPGPGHRADDRPAARVARHREGPHRALEGAGRPCSSAPWGT